MAMADAGLMKKEATCSSERSSGTGIKRRAGTTAYSAQLPPFSPLSTATRCPRTRPCTCICSLLLIFFSLGLLCKRSLVQSHHTSKKAKAETSSLFHHTLENHKPMDEHGADV